VAEETSNAVKINLATLTTNVNYENQSLIGNLCYVPRSRDSNGADRAS
jgi:hypothetical protein